MTRVALVLAMTAIIAMGGARPAVAAFPGTNGRIAFAGGPGDSEIYTVNEDGSGLLRLTDNTVSDWYPAWSADGAKLAFTRGNWEDQDVYTMNADGTNPTRVTFDPTPEQTPAWSPDGRRIAFVKATASGSEGVYTMDAEGGNQVQIAGPGTWNPAWSPDGSRIAFQGGTPELGIAIYTVRPDGTDLRRATNDSGYETDAEPDWSPDGRKIAFTRKALTYDVYVMGSDGTGPAVNVSKRHSAWNPAWSPDGSKILFQTETPGRGIYAMNSDGSSQVPVVAGLGYEFGPSWAPGPPPTVPTKAVNAPLKPASCEVRVLARRQQLAGARTAAPARPRFPLSGTFVVRVRCAQATRLTLRGEVSVRNRSKPRSIRTYRLRPVTRSADNDKWLRVKLRLRPRLARRVIRKLRAGSRASGTFAVRSVNGGGTTVATVKVRRFRQ